MTSTITTVNPATEATLGGYSALTDVCVEVWVRYEPIGLVLAVMPWNFPCGR